jgi:hypothetical protein
LKEEEPQTAQNSRRQPTQLSIEVGMGEVGGVLSQTQRV